MVGQKFARLILLEDIGAKRGYRMWRCQCACGRLTTVSTHNLRRGSTTSCGCVRIELKKAHLLKITFRHGCARRNRWTPQYQVWKDIKRRCLNPKFKQWKDYGGRGISVCPEWRDSFEAFLSHIGPRPSAAHSIDRINNDGNYEPGNVRWATSAMQAANKRRRARAGRGVAAGQR